MAAVTSFLTTMAAELCPQWVSSFPPFIFVIGPFAELASHPAIDYVAVNPVTSGDMATLFSLITLPINLAT